MGNCPSESILCPFYHSWWTDPWNMLLPMGANPDTVTISGFSSGGQMSMQMSIAYSATIKGATSVQGENYGQDILYDFEGTKDMAIELAEKAQAEGSIDDLSNIKGQPYSVYAGNQIPGVDTNDVQENMRDFYLKYGGNVELVNDEYVHVWPVDYAESDRFPIEDCKDFNAAYNGAPLGLLAAINCGDDYAGTILKFLMEQVIPDYKLNDRDLDWQSKGVLRKFGQREFLDELPIFFWNNLADYGYVYYPDKCIEPDAKCHIHFHLHGCGGTAQAWGDVIPRHFGFLPWAASNDIIMVFPSSIYNPINFMGCWSTAESYFLDENYYNRDGVQNKALYNMIQKLTQPINESGDYLANNLANEDLGIVGTDIPATFWYYMLNFPWFTFTMGPLVSIGIIVNWLNR